jgi:hypothetical protein
MKKQVLLLFIVALVAGCTKSDQKRLPVSGIYILKGDSATFADNGNTEAVGTQLILKSGGQQAYGWSDNNDTLYKSLWKGDKLSVTSKSYTSIYYINGTTQGYLVDSSANNQVSITIQ